MTREQAKQNLVALGIEEPTSEQVDSYLNALHGEVQKEKNLAEKYKTDALKVAELQAKLDEINNANLTELEKANKATETANAQILELQAQIAKINLQKSLAEIGITGESAEKLFDADGKLDTSVLGQIITDRETKAISAKEQELLKGTPNPSGGNKDNDGKTPESELIASVAQSLANASNNASDAIVNAYL